MTSWKDLVLMLTLIAGGVVGIGAFQAYFPNRETAWAVGVAWALVGLIHLAIYWIQLSQSRLGEVVLIPVFFRLVGLPLILVGLVVGLRPVLSWFLAGFLAAVVVFMSLQVVLVLRNLRRHA